MSGFGELYISMKIFKTVFSWSKTRYRHHSQQFFVFINLVICQTEMFTSIILGSHKSSPDQHHILKEEDYEDGRNVELEHYIESRDI